jgi:hypothetical protein
MPTTSTYTFAGATSPIVGSNGNPFGSITTALTINAQGIVSAASGNTIFTATGSTITGFDAGYTFEIRFKSSAAPPGDRRIFTPDNAGTGNIPLSIVRTNAPTGGGTVVHVGTSTTTISLPAGFFVYDGAFHTYKFVYNTTTVEYFRDAASIGSGAIGAPGTSQAPNRIYIAGTQAGLASDAAPSDLTIEYAYISVGSPVTYTYARPTSDITTQWTPSTGTDHFALIDETTASDADYIYATAAGQTDEVLLASMSAPQAGTDLIINYKVAGIVGSANVTMSLRQGSGGTLIATDTAKTSDNTYQLVVPAATWASVTDWTDLRLRFVSA